MIANLLETGRTSHAYTLPTIEDLKTFHLNIYVVIFDFETIKTVLGPIQRHRSLTMRWKTFIQNVRVYFHLLQVSNFASNTN